jgi:hypothetical protein
MAVLPPVAWTISHSPRSRSDRTRRKDRHLKFYELRDNLRATSGPIVGRSTGAQAGAAAVRRSRANTGSTPSVPMRRGLFMTLTPG